MSGKDVPEDIKARLLAMHEENVAAKEQLKTAQDKLVKARAVRFFRSVISSILRLTSKIQFIKSQDKLFKEEQAKLAGSAPVRSILPYTTPYSNIFIGYI